VIAWARSEEALRKETPRTRSEGPVSRADDALASESRLVYPGRESELPYLAGDLPAADDSLRHEESQEISSTRVFRTVSGEPQVEAVSFERGEVENLSHEGEQAESVDGAELSSHSVQEEAREGWDEADTNVDERCADSSHAKGDESSRPGTAELDSMREACEKHLAALDKLEKSGDGDPSVLRDLVNKMARQNDTLSTARPSTAEDLDRRGADSRFV